MANPFLAEIRIFPFNFAPLGWALCAGQIMSIQQNTALFSLIGTTFGGNGTSTFGLPNFQGLIPVGVGQGPGLTDYAWGEVAGTPTVALNSTTLGLHTHAFMATTGTGNSLAPDGMQIGEGIVGAKGAQTLANIYSTTAPAQNLPVNAVGLQGGNLPHNNMMPYITLNFCIATAGIFPSRN